MAIAQLWHPVASTEAWDLLHWAMHPTLYPCICMVIKVDSDFTLLIILLYVGWSCCASSSGDVD